MNARMHTHFTANTQMSLWHSVHLDLLYCYKIAFGLICLDINKYLTFTSLPTRGHPYKLYKAQCENLKQCSFFTERVANVWNSLPANVDFSSLPMFKKSIIQVDLSQFLKCNVQWIISAIKFRSFYFTSCVYAFFLFCVFVFSIMHWMYVLSYTLGYGQ